MEYQVSTEFLWPQGYYADGVHAGLRKVKPDMGWLVSTVPAAAAGTYTTNRFQAAPARQTKQLISTNHELQALIMNSACANAVTGAKGEENAVTMRELAATKLDLPVHMVGVASTGVIGEQLPMAVIQHGIDLLAREQDLTVTEAILTTDKHAKTVSVTLPIDGQTVTISGFAKGSGMIHPKMATMLGFVFTDAAIAGPRLQTLISELVDTTFNQITVDGDTSTNDMVVALANGCAANTPLTPAHHDYDSFKAALRYVLMVLAQDIAADGEGATKLVEVNVAGAANAVEGQQAAKAVVGSNLVKAAVFGADPNWGRILAAIGQTDVQVDVHAVDVAINGIAVVAAGLGTDFDEGQVQATMAGDKVVLDVDLHVGDATGQAWGCDLTYKYVQINAAYRS